MTEFLRPRIVISKCFGFEAVRYGGGIVMNPLVKKLADSVDFIPVCPEMELGMPSPRKPLDIVMVDYRLRLIQHGTGKDYTNKIISFSNTFLQSLKEVDGFILKSKSPSCAISDATILIDGKKDTVSLNRRGFFADRAQKFFPQAAFIDENGLNDKKVRYQFVAKIFGLASLRNGMKSTKLLKEIHLFPSDLI